MPLSHSDILPHIARLEAEHRIRVLYACESGSRAWGFPSPDSDYDVRIVYVHTADWYLSIDEQKDTLEVPITGELDISGWELRKALRIFRRSNPIIYEWLQSPIVYRSHPGFQSEWMAMAPDYFSARVFLHHHLGLVQRAYEEIRPQPDVKLKKYFYILRSLLSARWVRLRQTIPPMELEPLLSVLDTHTDLRALIEEWRAMKAQQPEGFRVAPAEQLHQLIAAEMAAGKVFAAHIRTEPDKSEPLNQFFRKWLA